MIVRASSLSLAVLVLVACSSNSPNDDGANNNPPAGTNVTITQGAAGKGPNAFSPANLTISLASQTTVKWWNGDFSTSSYGGGSVTHQLVSDDGTTFSSPQIPGRGTFVATLSAPGSYTYHCTIHQGMTGTLTVNP